MPSSQMAEDYYAVLEVDQTADEAAIKTSYKKLAKQRHPDKNVGKPEAKEQFQIVIVLRIYCPDNAVQANVWPTSCQTHMKL